MFCRALMLRLRYRNAIPFGISVLLAAVTAAWPRIRDTHFHEGTSIWTMVLLVSLSAAFALLCGGRFRTFFAATAVMPPFLVAVPGWIQTTIRHPDYPIMGFVEYLLYCVVSPILLVWIGAKFLNRNWVD